MLHVAPGEPLLPVPEAVEQATGRRPSSASCHRWRLRGIAGIPLPTLKFAGRRVCSRDAVLRWLYATNAAMGEAITVGLGSAIPSADKAPSPITGCDREPEHNHRVEAAERELDREGL
ncbi:DUF1580 domain-containing protein [Pirellulimonas nuda]|uniref:DUF1580 domain-containing protein n=1 Tax=Pirellulimonas nuda TaxID=2528009 RepID=UPI0011A36D14